MSYLENKIETAIKFLNKPVSCLTQADLDAVTALLKDMQDELDGDRYKLVYYSPDREPVYIVKQTLIDPINVFVIEKRHLDWYEEKYTTFTKPEITKLKNECGLINWDNVICIKQNSGKEEQ